MARKIVWNKRPVKYLLEQLKWISKESVSQAELVEEAILNRLLETREHPERFPADKYKKANDGTFRVFEIKSYRVAYRFTQTEIRVLRIRHTKQEPRSY